MNEPRILVIVSSNGDARVISEVAATVAVLHYPKPYETSNLIDIGGGGSLQGCAYRVPAGNGKAMLERTFSAIAERNSVAIDRIMKELEGGDDEQ